MPQDPIVQLLDEHAVLRARLEPLRGTMRSIAAGGPESVNAALPVLQEAARVLTNELIAHARREDEVLFPAVESAMGGGFGPTTVMRQEHVEIKSGAELFHSLVRELHEVQHPAIVEAGAKLRTMLESPGEARGLAELLTGLLGLIDDHFAKEEQVLFPMSRELLGEAGLRDVGSRLEQFDAG